VSPAVGGELTKVERRLATPTAGAVAGILGAVLFVYILVTHLVWGRPAAPADAPLPQTHAAVR